MLETAWESRWMPDSLWGCSSVGRAPALQAGGQEFESLHLHSWLYIAVRKQSFLTHVQARYENKTFRKLMKASFQRIRNILFSQCTLKTAYWKSDTSSNWKVWNKYQDIRGVTRKCNQTNQNKQLLIVNTINQRMQRYASKRNTVPAVWIVWLS